ncbi:MAG: hypothetical protein ACOC4B_01875, partial [Bacteroidota bacterium]
MKYLIIFILGFLVVVNHTEGKKPVKDTVDFHDIEKPVLLHTPIYLNKLSANDTAFQKKHELQIKQ